MHQAPAAKLARPPARGLSINAPRDPNTLSNYHNFVTIHTTANFELDFRKKVLEGNVVLRLQSTTEKEIDEVVLDTRFVISSLCLESLSRPRKPFDVPKER